MTDLDRIPPQSIEAEQSLLGSILLDGKKIFDVIDDIRVNMFYKSAHRKIYNAMCELNGNNNPIDLVSVSDELKRSKDLEEVGGMFYLTELQESIPSAANIQSHARIVKEKWIYREVIQHSMEITGMAFDNSMLDELLEKIGTLSLIDNMTLKEDSFSEMVHKFYDEMDLRAQGKIKPGLRTGIFLLDSIISEFTLGELVTLAGYSSSGKTALALQIANYNAVALGKQIGIIGMEMQFKEYIARLLSMNAEINLTNIILGRLAPDEWQKLASISGQITNKGFHISDKPRMNIHEIRSMAKQWKRKYNIELLVIDNFNNMDLQERDSRANAIEDRTGELKALAKELNLVIFNLVHLSRNHERSYRRPIMQDLKGSTAFEQNSDCVMFVWPPNKNDFENDHGEAEIFIDKRRNGPLGTTNLSKSEYRIKFVKEIACFKEL
jgi:replicative DNA helicase